MQDLLGAGALLPCICFEVSVFFVGCCGISSRGKWNGTAGTVMKEKHIFADLKFRLQRRFVRKIKKPLYKKREENCLADGPRAVHITYYKALNMGDTVLSACVRRTLSQLCGMSFPHLVSVDEPVTDALIETINQADLLVIGGGGLFLPDTNKNSVSGWQWAIPPDQLKKIRVPIVVYTVGYNYFRGQSRSTLFEENLRLLLAKSSFIGLRNLGSCRAVTEILQQNASVCAGFGAQAGGESGLEMQVYQEANGTDCGADGWTKGGPAAPEHDRDFTGGSALLQVPEIVFQPCTTTLIRKLYPELPGAEKTGRIGLNLAFDRSELRFGEEKERILSQIAQAMKEIENRGYTIVYIAHCIEDFQFLPWLDAAGVRCEKAETSDWFPEKALSFYNRIDLVLGMRGHAQMIPFGLNKEIITLGTHDKMRWFLEDIDAEDWYIELRENPDQLKETIVRTFIRVHETESDRTRERLLAAQEQLWEITRQNAEKISAICSRASAAKKR